MDIDDSIINEKPIKTIPVYYDCFREHTNLVPYVEDTGNTNIEINRILYFKLIESNKQWYIYVNFVKINGEIYLYCSCFNSKRKNNDFINTILKINGGEYMENIYLTVKSTRENNIKITEDGFYKIKSDNKLSDDMEKILNDMEIGFPVYCSVKLEIMICVIHNHIFYTQHYEINLEDESYFNTNLKINYYTIPFIITKKSLANITEVRKINDKNNPNEVIPCIENPKEGTNQILYFKTKTIDKKDLYINIIFVKLDNDEIHLCYIVNDMAVYNDYYLPYMNENETYLKNIYLTVELSTKEENITCEDYRYKIKYNDDLPDDIKNILNNINVQVYYSLMNDELWLEIYLNDNTSNVTYSFSEPYNYINIHDIY